MQRERVQDPYPWTWEVALVVACVVILVGGAACQLARSAANWFAGAGWRWPTPDRLATSIPGLLTGDARAGLPDVLHAANAATLWGWLIGANLFVVVTFTAFGFMAWTRWGPGRMRGMATVTEAHELLGRDRLWIVRSVVRPDLYSMRRRAIR